MSQKSTRRARRQTIEEEKAKAPTPKPNENAEDSPPVQETNEETASVQEGAKIEQNGTEKDSTETESTTVMVTRSRSATPQVKKVNGHEDKEKEGIVVTPQDKEKEGIVATQDKEKEEIVATAHDKDVNGSEDKEQEGAVVEEQESEDKNVTETEMDPLIISDEPDPELVFEENSDLESGKGSPVLTRCMTRRSATRNIPTPKTPKLVEENDHVTPSPPMEVDSTNKDSDQDLNQTFESCSDDISTKAQGGDSTRLDYMNKDSPNFESNSFLQEAKTKSFGETLRRLSTRRTIRPIYDDYRKRLLQTNVDKTDYSATYPTRNSVERISSVGVKRKNCSEGDDGFRKKPKKESPGFLSKFASPITSIKNTFRSDIPSSTPKLMGYKDEKFMLEDDDINPKMYEVESGERRWCSIM